MGVSTDAILFWGIAYGEDEVDLELDREEGSYKINGVPMDDLVERNPGITFDFHCSDGSPMLYVAPNHLVFTANRGYPQDVDRIWADNTLKSEAVKWLFKLQDAVEAEKLPWRTPHLMLASWWG